AIFDARDDGCPPPRTLRETYGDEAGRPLPVGLLSHLVSCGACLDAANRILGLPTIADRHPSDMLGPDRRNRGGGGGSPSSLPGLRRARQKLRDVFEHRPRELRLVVNGVERGWQTLTGVRTELTLVLEPTETVDFVELSSEQGCRLLLLNV